MYNNNGEFVYLIRIDDDEENIYPVLCSVLKYSKKDKEFKECPNTCTIQGTYSIHFKNHYRDICSRLEF